MYIVSTKPQIKNQLVLIILAAISAIITVILATSLPASARHGLPKPGNASIGAVAECMSGTWVNHVSVISNNTSLGEVDVYETLNSTQVIKVANELALSTTVPTTFDTTPAAGVTQDVLYVLPFNSVPLGDVEPTPQNDGAIATSAQITNPC